MGRRRSRTEQHTFRTFLKKVGAPLCGPDTELTWCDVLAVDELDALRKLGEELGPGWEAYTNTIGIPHVGYLLGGTHPMRLRGNGVWERCPS